MRKFILISLMFLFISSNLYAFNWKQNSIKVISSKTTVDTNETSLKLKDKAGKIFGVRYFGAINDKHGIKIIEISKKFRKWKNMTPGKVNFFVINDVIEITIIPSKLKYKKVNLISFLPAGMMFSFDENLKYNFRITKNNVFVRIQGNFIDEEELLKKIDEAVKNPIMYLKKRDPEFFFKKLNRLDASFKDLRSKHEQLQKAHKKLLNAVMTLHNTGFLGIGNSEIKKKIVLRVIELKTKNPKLTKDKISEKLDKEKIDHKKHEVFLILSVFFNDFK